MCRRVALLLSVPLLAAAVCQEPRNHHEVRPTPRSVVTLVREIRRLPFEQSRDAALELHAHGAAAVPALVDLLASTDEHAFGRLTACVVIDAIGGDAVPPLTRLLRTGDTRTREVSAVLLGRIGRSAASARVESRR